MLIATSNFRVLRRPIESAQYVSIKYTERLAEAGIEPSVGVFLLSDRLAGYITVAELIVDGGLRLPPIFGGSADDLRVEFVTN